MTNNADITFATATYSTSASDDVLSLNHSQQKINRYIEAYRQHGYRVARLDPLDTIKVPALAELSPSFWGITDEDVRRWRTGSGFAGTTTKQLNDHLQALYAGSIGVDGSGVRNTTRQQWLFDAFEQQQQGHQQTSLPLQQQTALLQRLIQAEQWEHFVQEHYPKAKRFSLEGCESLLLLMDALLDASNAQGIRKFFFAMPHRGRLNLLVNFMQIAPERILSHFDTTTTTAQRHHDLPFHLGVTSTRETVHGVVELKLAHNPSHLESVYPILLGMTRAAQDAQSATTAAPTSVVLHGDAAFSGQGVVMESLKLSQHQGYAVNGTIHVIINNQIGFTTPNPLNPATHVLCTDIARIVDAPVLHVNADDPVAVVQVAQLAFAYRQQFGVDVVIDLVGYRRWGHAEQDTASVTQAPLHALIDRQPTITTLFQEQLQRNFSDFIDHGAQWREQARKSFHGVTHPARQSPQTSLYPATGAATETAVPLSRLRQFVDTMTTLPPHFDPHPVVATLIDKWQAAVTQTDGVADWCLAENLAYASLLSEGYSIRLSGMDVERGTFMHRHAIWHNQQAEIRIKESVAMARHMPLLSVAAGQARCAIVNSPLSEEAVLGFEYGYSVQTSKPGLVMWEAQFGDFVNGAQIMVDQYVSSGAAKWGYTSGLVMSLPHGYEGVGPEHSSAYLSRFLLLCAEENMRVVYLSESAQWFHLLREQARSTQPTPLIVMAPKAQLYQNQASFSEVSAITGGAFAPVLADPQQPVAEQVKRVVLCSGKVFHDLDAHRRLAAQSSVALLRVEQLYPFPATQLQDELTRFPSLTEVVWVQEEDKNQGAWYFLREHLEAILPDQAALRLVCRPARAAGAHASSTQHKAEQAALLLAALQ
ncbi:2-oxoglutarate dehydrogenase E1 component [Herbaspirillum sp. Sphag1AN]|uniref:2-oxoglutarate dehydrogenase E1 component n=1 Tax=unclassified Herbaspirillum TaxID=2624150 RepID=UPI0016111C9C|nr:MULTISPECIES: 2-oxoglutarate dehydrogenase E1 component [unclassified Herbaspirillum]MBB3213532.1 2-oxoglutarate dehydrogenase E1 component [Herbaspirillum sp. Sphag1AN]MBB3246730.1 2-oxoglutarate dehydrogenase E1 component [Herbaspirillum sp. Sphag64]